VRARDLLSQRSVAPPHDHESPCMGPVIAA